MYCHCGSPDPRDANGILPNPEPNYLFDHLNNTFQETETSCTRLFTNH
jgi:hypothetical protein